MLRADARTENGASSGIFVTLGLLCIGLAFLVPAHYPPWASFQSQWLAGLGVVLLLLQVALGLGQPSAVRRPAWLAWAAAATALVPFGQAAFGLLPFHSDGIIPGLYWLGAGLAIAASADLACIDRTRWLDGLFASLGVAALLSAGIGLSQWLEVSVNSLWVAATPPGGRPFANLGQPNHLATLLLLGQVGFARAYEHRRLGPAVFALASAWLCIALVATQSRSGLLGLCLLGVWWAVAGRRNHARLGTRAILMALIIVAALAVAWEPLSRQLLLTTAQPLGDRMAPGPRTAIWMQAFEASLRRPWLGYGWNQAASAQLAVAADFAALGRPWDSAHNVVLDLALAMGWPLTLLWVVGSSVWLWQKVRHARDANDLAAVGGIAALLTHALLEYPLEYAYFLAPLALLVGATGSKPPGAARTLPRSLATAMGACLLAALAWTGIEYLQVEQAHRNIRMSLMNFATANPVRGEPADVTLLDAPVALQRLMLSRATADMPAAALRQMREAAHRYPMPPALMRLALAQGLNGQLGEAQLTLRRLCAVHPPARCVEGRDSWLALQQQYPVLATVPAPEVPAER